MAQHPKWVPLTFFVESRHGKAFLLKMIAVSSTENNFPANSLKEMSIANTKYFLIFSKKGLNNFQAFGKDFK